MKARDKSIHRESDRCSCACIKDFRVLLISNLHTCKALEACHTYRPILLKTNGSDRCPGRSRIVKGEIRNRFNLIS